MLVIQKVIGDSLIERRSIMKFCWSIILNLSSTVHGRYPCSSSHFSFCLRGLCIPTGKLHPLQPDHQFNMAAFVLSKNVPALAMSVPDALIAAPACLAATFSGGSVNFFETAAHIVGDEATTPIVVTSIASAESSADIDE